MTKQQKEERSNGYYLHNLRYIGFEGDDDELTNQALKFAYQEFMSRLGNGIYSVSRSPFHKDSHHGNYVRDAPKEKVSFRMPKTAFNDLMTYFKGKGLTLSEGMNMILTDRLEMINTSKRTIFNNSEIVMLIPKSRELSDLKTKSKIIGIFNPEIDFAPSYVYKNGFKKKFNIRYQLEHFIEGGFPLEDFRMMKDSRIYGVRLGEMMDWASFHQRMSALYSDLDNCFFVKFPLNNYLDVNRQGQFQHPQYMGKHQGLYAFDDFGGHFKSYMILDWEYHASGLLTAKFDFIPRGEFHHALKTADFSPLNSALKGFQENEYDKSDLKEAIEEAEAHLQWLKELYERV